MGPFLSWYIGPPLHILVWDPKRIDFLGLNVSLGCSYPQVKVTDFTTSWKDGLAFNALIHKHR